MGHDKEHLIEVQTMGRHTGDREMANVDGVESSAENADSCHLGDTLGRS